MFNPFPIQHWERIAFIEYGLNTTGVSVGEFGEYLRHVAKGKSHGTR